MPYRDGLSELERRLVEAARAHFADDLVRALAALHSENRAAAKELERVLDAKLATLENALRLLKRFAALAFFIGLWSVGMIASAYALVLR